MFWINIKRVFRTSFVSFWRNGFVSLASVLVMVITLFVIGLLIFTGALLSASLLQLKDKVDVNVYFVTGAPEESILALKRSVEALPEVASVEYISRDEALAAFRGRHENDQLTLQALDELGNNPLGAALNIKAKETSQYETIADFLKNQNSLSPSGTPIIDKVNYYQNKNAIDQLTRIIAASQKLGLAVAILFGIISILITFNTIRLAIYTAREEVSVMRLVGASSMYIRGPFVVSGLMYGLIAAIITLILFYPLVVWLGPVTADFFGGINLGSYYFHNFIQMFLIIVGSGMSLGALSSYLAVRKYLTV